MNRTRFLLFAGLLLGSAAQAASAQATAVQGQAAPLVIRVRAEVPALRDGKAATFSDTRELTIPAQRAEILRQRGVITQSLGEDLDKFVRRLDTEAGARFEHDPNKQGGWVLVQHDRLKVDPEAARAAVLAALKDPTQPAAQLEVTGQTAPERDLNYFTSRGITGLLGVGNTNYRGSSEARKTNIHVGASRFQDRLFEGKVFSFNQFLGPITRGAGFVDGLVISGGRTDEGLGGGICQVSTTAFRSLYMAGLPVRERSPHSYQVGFYQPQGLDAAIYQPTLDLKFTNDTGEAIWFQSDWDDETGEFNIYSFGKPRDFTVQLSAPRVISTVPAPADRLIPTDTLLKGQRRQVDWAVEGGTLEIDRLFVKDGKTVKKETLKSTYKPWPNIYLVGR